MPNQFYTENFRGMEHQLARATDIEAEFQRIESAFDMVGGTTSSITTTGTGAAYIGTLGSLTGYEAGFAINVTWHEPNTGPATLNIDGVGAAEIRTALNRAVEANDLRGFQRVIHDGTNFRVISPVDSDMRTFAADATRGITQGNPGLPGTSKSIPMNQIAVLAPIEAGEYRFLMAADSTSGTATDAGLRAAMVLEVYQDDADGDSNEGFYSEIEEGDVVVLYVTASRWYAYRIDGDPTVDGNVHTFPIMFVSAIAGDTSDIPAAETAVELRFSRSQTTMVGVEGVTGDDVILDSVITVHETPSDYSGLPLSWPIHGDGTFFFNNMGRPKTLVITITENGAVLTAQQHDSYQYEWLRNGEAFTPSIASQNRTRRWMTIGPLDLNDRSDQFSCRVCLAP